MRRKEKLITLFILIMILTITLIYKVMTPQNVTKTNAQKSKLISMMYEQEDGKYVPSEESKWPIRGYVFNQEKSYCENKSILEWNNVSKRIKVKVTGTDKCYVYFDLEELGTEESPYRIRVIEDLVDLANEVNGGENYASKIFTLEKDLDFNNPNDYENAYRRDYGDINKNNQDETLIDELTNKDGCGFNPIGNLEANPFSGIFDGQNKRIENLYINNKKGLNFVGFVGHGTSITIKNLTISGNISSTDKANIGGIIGNVSGNSVLENCHNEATITSNSESYSTGGILGANQEKATIKNCINKGNIFDGNNTGGLIGYNNETLTIEDSINEGVITNNLGTNAGGLLGRDNAATNSTEIINSYNNNKLKFKTNREVSLYIGGLVGIVNGKLNIKNSYNSSDIEAIIEKEETFESYHAYYLGGIVGDITPYANVSILNSFNTGNIANSTTAGGLVALDSGVLVINNSHNEGNITSNLSKSDTCSGGIVGQFSPNTAKGYILNSYNKGKLVTESANSAGFAGGISCIANHDSSATIINSYNIGDIFSSHYAHGIIYLISNGQDKNAPLKINNVYNLGNLTGTTKYGIAPYITTGDVSIKNAYYENSVSGSNQSGIGNAMSKNDMLQQTFVNILNQNLANINLGTIDSNLNGYNLNLWELNEDNIPVFAYDIKDLSGNGNNALDYSVSKSNEGIITSNTSKAGYINMGLINYDFGSSLSFVVRVKFNNFVEYQDIISNADAVGGGFAIYNKKLSFSLYGAEMNPPNYYGSVGNTIIETDKWYTLVLTYDGKNIKVYINGEEDASSALTGKIKPSPTFMALGANPSYNGGVDNVYNNYVTYSDALVFDRALTAEEIAKSYVDIPNPENKDELLVWYKFS